jgi:N-acetylmuramoyl-L-alanine amidase
MSSNDRRRGWTALAVALAALLVPPGIWANESHAAKIAQRAAGCDPGHFTIAVDVGHGAAAPGAISARLVTEYYYNLKLANAVRDALAARGFVNSQVLVTPGADLASRPARAAAVHADAFISIHHDSTQRPLSKWTTEDGRTASYSDDFRGYGVFYSDRNKQAAKSLALARLVGGEMRASGVPFSPHHAENIPGEGRPIVDRANGVYLYRELKVLKLASMPAVLLEAGVIVNRQEELEIASATRRSNTAHAVASAFAEFCTSANAMAGEPNP